MLTPISNTFFLLLTLTSLPHLALTSSIIPILPCDPRISVSGGVYTCRLLDFQRSDTQDCEWFAPDPSTSNCVSCGDDPADRPRSIGPDAGSTCALFDGVGCKGRIVG
jgi:hypothetical protein